MEYSQWPKSTRARPNDPLRDEFIFKKQKIYLHFLSFRNTEIAYAAEMLHSGRKRSVSAQFLLLMAL